ncbi:MAG: lipopolysaccharide biosynthesis protein [Desulfamplus sp.]|nr:lipopolysaccharide biosynthesis protein [Desulfamplus sp.]
MPIHKTMQDTKKLEVSSLKTNVCWTFLGNVVYVACQWGMLIAIAKLSDPEAVGKFAIGVAITSPVIMFLQLQLRAVQATDAKGEYKFEEYLGLRIICVIIGMIVILGVSYIASYPVDTFFVILSVGILKSIESISDIFYGLMQRYEQMIFVAKSKMFKGPLMLVALSSILYLTNTVFLAVVGGSIIAFLIVLFYDRRVASLIFNNFRKEKPYYKIIGNKNDLSHIFHFKKLLKLSVHALPLGIVMALITLNVNIPRYFVEIYFGEVQLGYFVAMAYLIVAGNVVISALGQSCSPRLATYFLNKNKKKYIILLVKLVLIGTLVGIAGILLSSLLGDKILTLIYNYEYSKYHDVFIYLMIVGALSYIAAFLGFGITAARYFIVQMPLFFIVSFSITISSLLFIPKFALKGAAMSLGVGAIVQILGTVSIIYCIVKRT